MASPRSSRRSGAHSSAGDSPSRRTAARTRQGPVKGQSYIESTQALDTEIDDEPTGPVVRTGIRFTRRIIAFIVVLAILVVSLITSLMVFFNQRQQMAEAQNSITTSTHRIAELEQEKQRLSDSDYVKAQARARFGWIMPGETGYRVVDSDGNPYGGGSEIDRTGESTEQSLPWWQRIWDSAESADQPTTSTNQANNDQVVTAPESPSASATP